MSNDQQTEALADEETILRRLMEDADDDAAALDALGGAV